MLNQVEKIEKSILKNTQQLVGPISEGRILDCIESAYFWASRLPRYAGKMRRRADNYAIASTILSTITALGIWSTFASSSSWPAILAVSLVAIISAFVVQVPKIRGYAKCAEDSANLGSRYGNVLGELKDSLELLKVSHQEAQIYAKN